MSVVSTSIGLISGLNTGEIVDALINAQRASAVRLESRHKNYENTRIALKTLEATLLSVKTAVDGLGKGETFAKLSVTSSDSSVLTATTRSGAVPGTSTLEAIRRASAHVVKTRGFSNENEVIGAGTITLARGGEVDRSTSLSLLNGGSGVRPGVIRITDRAGVSTDVDLTSARSVTDVIDAINSSGAAVSIAARGDRFVLTDRSGGAGNLTVLDLGGGTTAADLGIGGSVSASELTGASIYSVSESFALSQIDDGNAPRFSSTGADLRIALSDGTQLDIEMSSAKTLRDVLTAINDHAGNGGKAVASLVNGRIVIDDTTGGAGALSVSDLSGANVARSLGLDTPASGATLAGKALSGGMNTVLLRNLRGGQGIGEHGQITLTDRSGATATIDLSNAESLDDVLSAINAAQTGGGQKLAITAAIDDAGLGIVLRDTSGALASNMVVADVGTSTLAADLNIAIDGAVTTVKSGSLGRRYVSESTTLSAYLAGGKPVGTGNFTITDSAGVSATVAVTSQVQTIGDLLDRINAASVGVTARLNDTGDGIVLVDVAGGAGSLSVADLGTSKVAANLKIAGTAEADSGSPQIDGRQSVLVTLDADDTVADLEVKLRSAGAGLTASLFDDGSAANPVRLLLTAQNSGEANRLRIDDGGLGLGLATVVQGQDALLRVGNNPATGLLLSSSTNSFKNVPGALDVELLKVSDQPVEVTVGRDQAAVQATVKQLVTVYNQFVDTTAELTRFDPVTNQRGVLQGDGTVARVRTRLDSLLAGSYGTDASISTIADLGITFGPTGKLVLDEERLANVLRDNPDAVKSFFSDKTHGFGAKATKALDSLTNPLTGSFKLQDDALADSMERIEQRVAHLDDLLLRRRDRLIRQFAKMEEALSGLQAQQNALLQLASLSSSNQKK